MRVDGHGLSAVLKTLFTVKFISKGFEIMDHKHPCPSHALINDDKVVDVLISSLFSSWLERWLRGVALMKLDA